MSNPGNHFVTTMRAGRLPIVLTTAVLAVAVSDRATTISAQNVRVEIVNPNALFNQPMPKGTGSVAGQVRDARANGAVPGAVVTLSFSGHAPERVLTDTQGRFAFADLPQGPFIVTATQAAFSSGAFGRLRPGGASYPLELGDGERLTDATILLWPLAAIGGTVVDDLGEPVAGLTVHAYRRAFVSGRPRFTAGPTDATDDRGAFRIAGLEPGDYIVGLPMTTYAWPASLENHMLFGGEWPRDLVGSAAGQIQSLIGAGVQIGSGAPVVVQMADRVPPAELPGDGRVVAYASQFFAGASSASEASSITLAAGEERGGVGLTLRAGRTWNVSGSVTGVDGAVDDLVLRLSPAGAGTAPIDTAIAVTDFLGRFTFVGVPPGQYVARALRMPRDEPVRSTQVVVPLPRDPVLWAEQTITVGDDADLTGVTVTVRAGARVRGRVEFRGSLPQPAGEALERLRISLEAADERTASLAPAVVRGRIERAPQFATIGAPAGRYVAGASGAPDGWTLQAAMLGGRDISIEPLDLGTADIAGVTLIFTDVPSSLAGTVSSQTGGADPSAAVIVFPADPAAWLDRGVTPRQLRRGRTDRSGRYAVPNLPPGKYFVAAVNDAATGDWEHPAFLEALARSAMRIDLAVGETKQTPLQTVKPGVR